MRSLVNYLPSTFRHKPGHVSSTHREGSILLLVCEECATLPTLYTSASPGICLYPGMLTSQTYISKVPTQIRMYHIDHVTCIYGIVTQIQESLLYISTSQGVQNNYIYRTYFIFLDEKKKRNISSRYGRQNYYNNKFICCQNK